MRLNLSRLSFGLLAALPVAASLALLSFAEVSRTIWLLQLLWILLACGLGMSGRFLARLSERGTFASRLAMGLLLLTVAGLALPLLGTSPGPERWISLGPLKLYVAPLLLPSFLAAGAVSLRAHGRRENLALGALTGAGVLLALQPDASQALALLAGFLVLLRYRPDRLRSILVVAVLGLVTAWAFCRPDPLEPVAHVEEVFRLALAHSLFAGLAVIVSAVALIAGLLVRSWHGAAWLAAVAAYYAVLFVCSVAGLTPAPLIGYGAGPLLGFGLLAAVSAVLDVEAKTENTVSCPAN